MFAPTPILIVDDEIQVLSALRRTLGRHGFFVHLAENAEAALSLLDSLDATKELFPRVVLSDFRLPRMDGVSLLSLISQRWPLIQRVLLTGYADMEAIERAINQAGIYQFVTKPWDDLRLLSTLRAAVERWQTADENRRLLQRLEDHNRLLEETVASRTQELEQTHRLWERSFNAIFDPVIIVDEHYRITSANQAFSSHLGLSEDSPIGKVCHTLRAGSPWPLPRSKEGPCVSCPVARTRNTRAPSDGEWTTEAGALQMRSFPLEDMTVCVYRDVTSERETLRQIALTDRLAAIGQLAGGIAHEINNPLSGILASVQLLLRGRPEDPREEQEFLCEIESAAVRCKRVVEHLLRFSRQARRDEIGRVNLNNLIQDALPLLERQYALRGVHLCCSLSADLPDVMGSSARLMQVLMNLLSNAFEATLQNPQTRDPGPEQPKRQIFLTTASESGVVLLQIRDQGQGIKEADLPNLFLPFFTTKPEGRGPGLGLSVAYGIVCDHGGEIHAENIQGGGAEFLVMLPGCPPADVPAEPTHG